jgi:hypothetical protein
MGAPLPAVAWRTVRECAGCRYHEAASRPALCTWHPPIVDREDWPAMVRRVEVNRHPHGICGTFGRLYRAADITTESAA